LGEDKDWCATMGPLLTFDKSFLEMLNPCEVDELDLQFKLFVTPILISEILADLKHPAPRQGKLPVDLVKALARKLVSNHGMIQMHFRALGLGEITQSLAAPVAMNGQVIVDATAPNVMQSKDGLGIIYDGRQDWEMWNAWANGNFTQTDEYLAARWREQSAQIDLVGITEFWTDFCKKYLAGVRTIADVIERVHALIAQPKQQPNFLEMVFHFLEAPQATRVLGVSLLQAGLLPNVRSWAPYSSSIARLGMIFCCCLTLKYVTSRPTNVLDLQYLFYAPFGMVFVSHDRLHRDLWPATTTEATFVWGTELKADLQRYVQAREVSAAARARGETPSYYAASFTPETSLIARLRAQYMKPRSEVVSGPTGDFELLPDDVKRQFREAMELLDERDARRRGSA
jgi:hypothetical protein